MKRVIAMVSLLLAACVAVAADAPGKLGEFEASADVGAVNPPGTATYDAATKQYRLTSAGENIWNKVDAFHFCYRKVSGDVSITADVDLVGAGKNAHRKAGVMIRQSLDADAPYVDVMVHGDGSIGLQYRKEKGGITAGTKPDVKAPVTVKLSRKGDTFTMWLGTRGQELKEAGAIEVKLVDPVYVGLALSAHDATTTETATFANLLITGAAK